MGFIVVLTITPFVSTSSSNFVTGVEQSLFVRELSRAEEADDIVIESDSRIIPPALTSYKVSKRGIFINDYKIEIRLIEKDNKSCKLFFPSLLILSFYFKDTIILQMFLAISNVRQRQEN